ncbi:MAG: hypothetical protein COA59_16785 [Colwellia sp.]|jgi:hypothetical protein|nr:MAG: hypothetical protein COA59_16785 [Colwellia sp.]
MTDFDHRVGVKEINLVIRTLKLSGITDVNKMMILTEIDKKFGIDAVSFEDETHELHLAYDASNINLEGIENIIKKHDADVADTWWNHVKEDYYKFVDQNVKDNAEHIPWSCHKTRPGADKK